MTDSNATATSFEAERPDCRCTTSTGPYFCAAEIARAPEKNSLGDGESLSLSYPLFTFHSSRPDFENHLWDILLAAKGETGVSVCGPSALSSSCRRVVAKLNHERGWCRKAIVRRVCICMLRDLDNRHFLLRESGWSVLRCVILLDGL